MQNVDISRWSYSIIPKAKQDILCGKLQSKINNYMTKIALKKMKFKNYKTEIQCRNYKIEIEFENWKKKKLD